MKHAVLLAMLLFLVLGTGGCAGAGAAAVTSPVPPGGTLYTQFNVQYEKDIYRTTNYRRGVLLPINSEVTFVSADSRRIVVRMKDNGRRLTIENVPKHTNQTVSQAFHELLGAEPVDLSGFSDAERAAIAAARVEPGMSRKAVLAAIGPPPASGTLNRASPEWKYWSSRFSTFLVHFDADGRVVGTGR